jgi:hypothetical protein
MKMPGGAVKSGGRSSQRKVQNRENEQPGKIRPRGVMYFQVLFFLQ